LIVVSDTSPILNLARIGRLELLPQLYRQVLIPSAVFAELTVSERNPTPAIDPVSMPWLIVAIAKDRNRVQELRKNLDAGEAVLDDLIQIARFWIGPDLYKEVLEQLGEA
jgi:uncharacterized protein